MVSFKAVNRRGDSDYRDDWQRHHLIPLQLSRDLRTAPLFARLKAAGFDFDDFETNGILLPATRAAARTSQYPMHAGPHPLYNRCVADRILAIGGYGERRACRTDPLLFHVRHLQIALRSTLREGRLAARPLDTLDLSGSEAHLRALDAAVDALFARFAVSPDNA